MSESINKHIVLHYHSGHTVTPYYGETWNALAVNLKNVLKKDAEKTKEWTKETLQGALDRHAKRGEWYNVLT